MIEIFNSEQLCLFFEPHKNYNSYLKRYKDHQNRLKYFNLDGFWQSNYIFVIAIEGKKIIGILAYVIVENKTLYGHKHFLSYISVDPQHQNKGIAKTLINHWVQFAFKPELGECGCSGYTQNGYDWLKPILENLSFPIQKREREF